LKEAVRGGPDASMQKETPDVLRKADSKRLEISLRDKKADDSDPIDS
jgi:hypothetical protein